MMLPKNIVDDTKSIGEALSHAGKEYPIDDKTRIFVTMPATRFVSFRDGQERITVNVEIHSSGYGMGYDAGLNYLVFNGPPLGAKLAEIKKDVEGGWGVFVHDK